MAHADTRRVYMLVVDTVVRDMLDKLGVPNQEGE